jgi:hypothetical protein
MAKGRTISANFLTNLDKDVLNLCFEISQILLNSITEKEDRKDFKNKYGKMSKTTRDASKGLGGGKLQRDALCTRGIQGNAPFSNRNLRWHPLVVAQHLIPFAKPIERIEIEGASLNFIVKNSIGEELSYPSEKVYELPERYVVLPEHWVTHIDTFKTWKDVEWTQNSCVITAYEACDWQDAVQSFAVLGISIVVGFYEVDFEKVFLEVSEILENQNIDINLKLPTQNFPNQKEDIIYCPLCKVPANQSPAYLPKRKRELRWKPEWASSKRGEGEDSSLQIMHIEPLTESIMRHNAKNVRFGHRWCNVAMTDHSISETVNFMEYITKAHNRI